MGVRAGNSGIGHRLVVVGQRDGHWLQRRSAIPGRAPATPGEAYGSVPGLPSIRTSASSSSAR